MKKVFEALDKLEECANGMKDLPKSNWIDLAENEAKLDLKIMDWVETIKFELFKGKQALTELKQIKEAKPSEAMEGLNKLVGFMTYHELYDTYKNELTSIKQALLKAQELKKVIKENAVKAKLLRHRKGYYKGCYYDLETKEHTIQNNNITLKEALDCWWNSIRIDEHCVYKNAYTCDPVYELDGLKNKDLKRKIFIDYWTRDADGYPIAIAKFID